MRREDRTSLLSFPSDLLSLLLGRLASCTTHVQTHTYGIDLFTYFIYLTLLLYSYEPSVMRHVYVKRSLVLRLNLSVLEES